MNAPTGWEINSMLAVWTRQIGDDVELRVKRVGRGRNIRYIFTASLSFVPQSGGVDEIHGYAKTLVVAVEQAEEAQHLLGEYLP